MTPTTPSTPAKPSSPPRTGRVRAVASASIAVVVLAALAACAPAMQTPAAQVTPEAFGHVHALDVDPATGRTYAATHHGVWLVPTAGLPDSYPGAGSGPDGPTRIDGPARDTMAFTVARPGALLASGHPDPAEDFDLALPNLGLVASTDGAETWVPVSLRGDVDFHDLEAVELPDGELRVYGHDSADAGVLVSDDAGGTWREAGRVEARDLAADPSDPDRVYATTAEGLMLSEDGGMTFRPVEAAPPLYLVTVTGAGELIGIDVEGTVQRFDGTSWSAHGVVEGTPDAFAWVEGTSPWLLVADERGVVASDDLGVTVTTLVPAWE
jgi:hypothetical protein